MEVHIYFEPLKLISACNTIKKEYQNKYDYERPPSGHLEALLEEISRTNMSDLEGYANVLKDYDVNYLAWYLPKEENLILNTKILRIISNRISRDVFTVYFLSWQKYYGVLSNNIGTKNLFTLADKGAYLSEEAFTSEIRNQMLIAPVDEVLSKSVSDRSDTTNDNYSDILSVFYQISPSSVLGINILKKIYLVCSEKHLLKTTDLELCNIANAYVIDDAIKFFVNFVVKVNPTNYRNYLRLADLARSFFNKGRYRIDNFDAPIRVRFQMWFSLLDLDRIFGEDERGIFWKARAIENNAIRVEKKTRFNMVVMYFDTFVATEFLIKADGPIYIVPNEEYTAVMDRIIHRASSKSELKAELYHLYQYNSCRIEHRSNWRAAAQYKIQQLRK